MLDRYSYLEVLTTEVSSSTWSLSLKYGDVEVSTDLNSEAFWEHWPGRADEGLFSSVISQVFIELLLYVDTAELYNCLCTIY